MNILFKWIKNITYKLAQPHVFFYCGLWFLVLLCFGTIEQKYIGLYQAQAKYFSSFYFWFYMIPLPSGWTTMGIILTSLLLKTISYTQNIRKNLGSFVSHTGIILLFTGGFITALFSQEGYIQIPEGEESHIVSDYHNVELILIEKSGKKIIFEQKNLTQKHPLISKDLPFSLKIKKFIKNTKPIQRTVPEVAPFKGFAKIFELKEQPLDKINENNLAGMTFQILKEGKKEVYSIFEGMPILQTIKWKNETYTVKLRPAQTKLPFSIYLLDFEQTYYPGTLQPRFYKSTVEIRSYLTKQKRVIQMNQPLRYKGWTLYQSSFIKKQNSQITILAAVKNAGYAFPYLSSIIICFGLLIHIFITISPLGNNRQKNINIKGEDEK